MPLLCLETSFFVTGADSKVLTLFLIGSVMMVIDDGGGGRDDIRRVVYASVAEKLVLEGNFAVY